MDGGLVLLRHSTPQHIAFCYAYRIAYGQYFCLPTTYQQREHDQRNNGRHQKHEISLMHNLIQSDYMFQYWLTITAFIILSILAILPFTKFASILSCTLIGTFIFIVPVDHYIGTSLKFILVNVIRRTYVNGFGTAVLNFPFQVSRDGCSDKLICMCCQFMVITLVIFQINDIALVCGWIGLAFIALMVQVTREKNRAPFPINPYRQRR